MTAINTSTSSNFSRRLGIASILGVGVLLLFSFVISEPDVRIVEGVETGQFDAVRLLYVHVPIALAPYVLFPLCGFASFMYLRKGTDGWDVLAHASAEVGVLFGVLTIATGAIWGKPVWNTWWEWGDVRVMTSMILVFIYVGYLALRSVPGDNSRRAAVVGIVGVAMLPIVNQSVTWWSNNTLHQESTLAERKIENYSLFTLFVGIVVFGLIITWLVVQRFRTGWLQHQLTHAGIDDAIAARRAEAEHGVDAALGRESGAGSDAEEAR